jgi:hypothetical protein
MRELNDICISIPINQVINFSENGIFNKNDTLIFVDSWFPPFVFSFRPKICGTLVKIIQELSKRHGYKYVKTKFIMYEILYSIKHLSINFENYIIRCNSIFLKNLKQVYFCQKGLFKNSYK